MSIYNNVHPDHPLNAFISSLCDDDFAKTPDEYQKRKKYCVIRRELQLLLESTHLFIIHNFDEEYAVDCQVKLTHWGCGQKPGLRQ